MEIIDPDPLSQILLILLNLSAPVEPIGVLAGTVAVIGLLALAALMSATEMTLLSFGPNQVHELRLSSHKADKSVLHLLEMPRRISSTVFIFNNFITVAIVIISTFLLNHLVSFRELPVWLVILVQAILVSTLILLVGEILPRFFAPRHNLRLARFMAGPLQFLIIFFHPLSNLLIKTTAHIEKKNGLKSQGSISQHPETGDFTASKDTPEGDKKLMQVIAKFGDIEVKEIMISRVDVTAVDSSTSFRDLLKIIIDSGYSRIPVYEDTFDNVKGILYIKDLLPHTGKAKDFDWKFLLREALFIPESKKINDLLQEFREKKVHMAVIVDEYGGTSGIVTLEDIIEEIVGEISDEHDEPIGNFKYTRLDESNYIFEGKISLNDMSKILGLEDDIFDEARGDADSLAGLLLELFEKMPDRDERVSFRHFTFTVKAADKRRIKRVLVTIGQEGEDK